MGMRGEGGGTLESSQTFGKSSKASAPFVIIWFQPFLKFLVFYLIEISGGEWSK